MVSTFVKCLQSYEIKHNSHKVLSPIFDIIFAIIRVFFKEIPILILNTFTWFLHGMLIAYADRLNYGI